MIESLRNLAYNMQRSEWGGGQKATDFSITTREARASEALQAEGNCHAKLSIQEQHWGMKVKQGSQMQENEDSSATNRPAKGNDRGSSSGWKEMIPKEVWSLEVEEKEM